MIEENHDFAFKFDIMSDFEYETAVNVKGNQTEWVYSAALKVYLGNWADFIVHRV